MGTRLADIIMDRHEDFLYEDSRAMKLTPYVMAERCLQAELTAIFLDGKEGDYSTLTYICLLYTSPSPRDLSTSRMPSSA